MWVWCVLVDKEVGVWSTCMVNMHGQCTICDNSIHQLYQEHKHNPTTSSTTPQHHNSHHPSPHTCLSSPWQGGAGEASTPRSTSGSCCSRHKRSILSNSTSAMPASSNSTRWGCGIHVVVGLGGTLVVVAHACRSVFHVDIAGCVWVYGCWSGWVWVYWCASILAVCVQVVCCMSTSYFPHVYGSLPHSCVWHPHPSLPAQ